MQKLILPLNNCQVLCGYKNEAYRKAWGRPHYGQDHWSSKDKTVWAMGSGEVMAAGFDNVYGGTAVVLYKSVYLRTGGAIDLVARCYHMSAVYVKAGQAVTTATKIGLMGNTGQYTSGEHLHVEFDTDTKWPCYTIELKNNSNIMKKGSGPDTTIDPAGVLYVKASAPDNQSVSPNESYLERGFITERDWAFPVLEEAAQPDFEAKYNELLALYEKTKADYQACYEDLAAEKQKRKELLSEILALVEKYKN
jgi:murein DD-endopeptidase MepM/ murein hydrolase activator NlpD